MILILILVGLGLLAGSLYAVLRAHVEAKAERETFQRIAQANSESREWPAPSGHKTEQWKAKRRA